MLSTEKAEIFTIENQTFYLLPERVIYWKEEKRLLLADLHLGKEAHFRKEGIAVPDSLMHQALSTLDKLLADIDITEVIFLGDLFHSDWNTDWTVFKAWLKKHKQRFILVKGNHDILNPEEYIASGMTLEQEPYLCGPFLLSHHPLKESGEGYNLCGHLHPGIKLKGKGRQSISLPCFYFGKERGVLPAFSHFSGKHLIKLKKTDSVFGITKEKVIRFN